MPLRILVSLGVRSTLPRITDTSPRGAAAMGTWTLQSS